MAIGNAISERWYYNSNGDLVRAQRGIYVPGGSGGNPGGVTELNRRNTKFGSFQSGTYTYGNSDKKPALADVGVYPDSDTPRTNFNSSSTQTVIITENDVTWQNLNVYGDIKIRAARFTAINCKFFGGPHNLSSNQETGIIDCNNVACVDAYFQDCTFDPQKPDFMRNAILGHKYTAERCYAVRCTDGFGMYAHPNQAGNLCDVNIIGCYVETMPYWANDPAHNDGTHNDCIQYQGGHNLLIKGNVLIASSVPAIWGSTNLVYGAPWSVSNPSIEPYEVWQINGLCCGSDKKDDNNQPDLIVNGHAHGVGILLQDGVSKGTVNVEVDGNWVGNGLASLSLKPTTGGGSYKITNNRLMRGTYYYTATSTYTIRIDSRANTSFSPALLDGGNVWEDNGQALVESTSGGIRYNA